MAWKPAAPFTVAMKLLIPLTNVQSYGAGKKTFPAPEDGILIHGSFRTFGGTENLKDGVYTLINTAVINTWYRPDITADCRICICETGQIYDIIQDPENIDMRHQYMQFKVMKVGGKP